jgi:glycosyltransferase involved in cell wall biosynthesis
MPTHERPDLLRKAIDSVIAQRYPNWELVVVDDGSDAGKSVVADVDDERITYVSIPHGGPCRARNEGLDRASGELIAYLDDDNVLHPGWLHAVAWAFGARPDHRVLYGARLNDDFDRVHGLATGGLPWLQFERWDRERLERSNLADIGVIAHRAGAPGARFDESFWECGDWDFLLSITEDHTPLELPAVAFSYRSDTADRLTGQYVDHEQAVRDKWAAKHRR